MISSCGPSEFMYLRNSAVGSVSFTSLDSSQAIENAGAWLMTSICWPVMFVAILMALFTRLFAEKHISGLQNGGMDIFNERLFHVFCICKWLSTSNFLMSCHRAAGAGLGDFIHFLKIHLLCSVCCSGSQIALYRSSPVRANISLHIKLNSDTKGK